MAQHDSTASADLGMAADPAPAPIPNFDAEIADAWAKLRELSDEDLDRVSAWLGAVREGGLGQRDRARTADQVAQLALEMHGLGRRTYALKRARERFRMGEAEPSEPVFGDDGEPVDELVTQIATAQLRIRESFAAINRPRRREAIAELALGIASRLLGDQLELHVPGACRLLRLAIAHATAEG